jgi:hypothetical protein
MHGRQLRQLGWSGLSIAVPCGPLQAVTVGTPSKSRDCWQLRQRRAVDNVTTIARRAHRHRVLIQRRLASQLRGRPTPARPAPRWAPPLPDVWPHSESAQRTTPRGTWATQAKIDLFWSDCLHIAACWQALEAGTSKSRQARRGAAASDAEAAQQLHFIPEKSSIGVLLFRAQSSPFKAKGVGEAR